jgi:hypothetical protein
MDTVELKGYGGVFRGTHYGSVGVYTHKDGSTYVGGHEGGVAHGDCVVQFSYGNTYSGQFAAGCWQGHIEDHCANGDVGYYLYSGSSTPVHTARVRRNGDCEYDHEPCGADHAGHAALKHAAQQAGVRMPPTRIHRNARAVGRTPTHAPFRFSHCARFWCLASARGFGRASASVRVCMCACVRVYL